jgi:hypothetical protein
MPEQTAVLDESYKYLSTYVIYPNEHAKVAHTLWIAGSYFLECEDIAAFDNFPIIAFLSPDEDSGKSRALDVTEALAHNAPTSCSKTATNSIADRTISSSRIKNVAAHICATATVSRHRMDGKARLRTSRTVRDKRTMTPQGKEKNIADSVEAELKKHVIFDNQEDYRAVSSEYF